MSWRVPEGWPGEAVPDDLARFGIGPRLAAIAELVPRGRSVADVGTDHGLLPIALVGSGRCPRGIGIDRRGEPLARAKANRDRFAVQVDLRLGDGLALEPDEAAVLVIAGVGGRTVCEVVTARSPAELGIERIVVQPSSDFEQVRRTLASIGYASSEERFVADGDRFFLVIASDRAPQRELSLAEAFLGLVGSDPLFAVWVELQLEHWSKKPASPEVEARLRLLSSSAGS